MDKRVPGKAPTKVRFKDTIRCGGARPFYAGESRACLAGWQAVKIGRISKIDPLLIELLIQIDSGATEESPCIIFFRNGSVGREIWHFRYFLVPPQAAKGG